MLISIIIPIFNLENVITHSLEAVCEQTYKNIELILVDDGSTDQSISVAESYLRNQGIEYKIIVQQNQGPSSARNNGICKAKGDWILCLDGDDYIAPETIEKMLSGANICNVKCVFCNYKTVNDDTIKLPPKTDNGSLLIGKEKMKVLFFQRKLVPITPGMLLHRSVYEKLKYDEQCRYCEDTLFLWELFYNLDVFLYLDADYYNYYKRESSTMHSLKPEKYLASSPYHKISAERLQQQFPYDTIAPMIYPKFRLAGLRIICRNNSFSDFIKTVKADGGNYAIAKLLVQGNIKLFLYASIFLLSKKIFYLVSKKIQ